MDNILEIRWHGRGGQGAATASQLLADAAFGTGNYVQGFPEYGPERMGAPITAYNRISYEPIRIHSNIYEPDFVVVIDETLLEAIDVTDGLNPEGALIINTPKEPEEIRSKVPGYEGPIYTVDARKVSMETIGRYFPNTPMLASVVKVAGIMPDDVFINQMQESFTEQFSDKPEVVAGNMEAVRMALKEVRC